MEKYYVAKLEEPGGELVLAKLVDIQFARRPPTFGTLYLAEANSPDASTAVQQQWLKLSTLNLANNQSARFAPIREINLTVALAEQHTNQRRAVDFNTLNEQLLLEVSHSSTSVERLRSSCFVLTQSGDLYAISLIDRSVKVVLSAVGQASERFLSFKLSMQREENVLDHQMASKSQPALGLHVLSEQTYYHYHLRLQSAELDCDVQLLSKYSTQDNSHTSRSLKFTQFWLINKPANETILLLKLNDNSRRFVKSGKCLQSIDDNKSNGDRNEILALPSNSGQETILLEYLNHKLVAYSLLTSDERPELSQSNGETRTSNEELVNVDEEATDPDGLLPRVPTFELEGCWSYDLDQIDGIRSKLMDDGDEKHELNSSRNKLNGCLCPLWLPEARAPSSSSKLFSQRDDESLFEAPKGWPKFLIVAAYSHLLLFCFEHEQALPFSVVYDRAFLDLVDGGSRPSERLQQQASGGKTINLKVRPKLVCNFKLIGPAATDSLMNLLFLTQKIHLNQVKHFKQLGLFAGLTSEHHLLALKLTSGAVLKHKDNLYQQSLLAALRQPGLLSDEIQRVEMLNSKLVERLAALEAGQLDFKQTRGADDLESLIQMTLRPDELIGGLYNLRFVWPTVVNLLRVVVTSTVSVRFLATQDDKEKIRGLKMNTFHHSGETLSALEREALFLEFEPKDLNDSAQASQLRHLESSIKAWAIVELDRAKNFTLLASNPFAEESFHLPVFLPDGQQSDAQIRAYFVLNNPTLPGFDKRNSSLATEMTFRKTLGPIDASLRSPCKFIKCQVEVKLLHSYQPVEELEENVRKSAPALKLEIAGPFSDENMLFWLNECLDIDPPKVQSQIQYGNKLNNVTLNFSSNFSHCFLTIQLAKKSNNQKQPSEGEVTICSDDFIALALIEKHLFKRATDDSIQLTRPSGRPLMVGIENLRHLIGRQQLNTDLYFRLLQRQTISNNNSDNKRSHQIDLLIENLMSEALDLQSLPIKPELKQSNLWLERSFRRDLERVLGSEADSNNKGNSYSQCRLNTFLDMICGYIIDALVDYDRMHQMSGSTDDAMLKMRARLMTLGQQQDLQNSIKFAEQVLKDWAEVKKIDR